MVTFPIRLTPLGWLNPKKSHSTPVSYFKINQCVASTQYSKCCKIFMFPLDFMQASWIKAVPFFASVPQIDLCFFLVLKLEDGPADKPIMTENIPLTSSNIFRVYYPPTEAKAGLIKSRIDNIRVKHSQTKNKIGSSQDISRHICG